MCVCVCVCGCVCVCVCVGKGGVVRDKGGIRGNWSPRAHTQTHTLSVVHLHTWCRGDRVEELTSMSFLWSQSHLTNYFV